MIDLTVDSDVDTPEIDHTTTLRANILRGFFDRSQSRSPAKPAPTSSIQKSHQPLSFLDMIRARRGFPIESKPAEDTGRGGEGGDTGGRNNDDDSSSRTHESSMADTDVGSPFYSYV